LTDGQYTINVIAYYFLANFCPNILKCLNPILYTVRDPTQTNIKAKRNRSVAQMAEHLASKYRALSSNPSTAKIIYNQYQLSEFLCIISGLSCRYPPIQFYYFSFFMKTCFGILSAFICVFPCSFAHLFTYS
jgi:hypothetical protein